jgi:hypothetical protein
MFATARNTRQMTRGWNSTGAIRLGQEAVRALPEVARDVLPDGTRRDFVIEVKDEAQRTILRAKLSLSIETILDA